MLIVAVVGSRKSGKTSIIEALVRELSALGCRVAVLKHIHHEEFEFDVPGKDTWRAFHAGSVAVVGASSSRTLIGIRGAMGLPALLRVVEELSAPDLILLEGFSGELSDLSGVHVISMGGRNFALNDGELICECKGPGDRDRAVSAVRALIGKCPHE